MPLNITSASSSRISKFRPKNASFKNATSIFSAASRRKAHLGNPAAAKDEEDDLFDERLEDHGLVTSLADELSLRDVAQFMKHAIAQMFDPMPEKGGMNGQRIAEVLNYRLRLPRIVTKPHIYAMISSPTAAEKEMDELVRAGILRRVVVPGRGVGSASISEGLVLVEDWISCVNDANSISKEVKEKYISSLKDHPQQTKVRMDHLTMEEKTILMHAGFLTVTHAISKTKSIFTKPEDGTTGTAISIASVSKAASGSLAAVGGPGAIHAAGGGGTSGLGSSNIASHGQEYQLSLPGTGAYLALLSGARSHLMDLLAKSKYNEAPLGLLRERWDGGVSSNYKKSLSRNTFGGLLPGRTRKWKDHYGLRFDWILAECMGAGMIEIFETGSVGRGVRVT